MSDIKHIAEDIEDQILAHMMRAGHSSSNDLKSASMLVLRGQRHGRRYKMPGTYRRQRDKATGRMRNGVYYTASAPGEPPANRTGHFRLAWEPQTKITDGGRNVQSKIQNNIRVGKKKHLLGELLEDGTSRMAPRPYKEQILEKALPKIKRRYKNF